MRVDNSTGKGTSGMDKFSSKVHRVHMELGSKLLTSSRIADEHIMMSLATQTHTYTHTNTNTNKLHLFYFLLFFFLPPPLLATCAFLGGAAAEADPTLVVAESVPLVSEPKEPAIMPPADTAGVAQCE